MALVLSPSEFARDVVVSDAEVKDAYDRGVAAGRYGTAERRAIEQIVFPGANEAAAAAERLKGGLAWDALLEELKLKPTDVDLGLKSRADSWMPPFAMPPSRSPRAPSARPCRAPSARCCSASPPSSRAARSLWRL